jgi:hypothetical protein
MTLPSENSTAQRVSARAAADGASTVTKEDRVMAAAAKLAKAAAPAMKLLAAQITEHGKADFDQEAAIQVGTDTYEHACHVLARVLIAHSMRVAHQAKQAETQK